MIHYDLLNIICLLTSFQLIMLSIVLATQRKQYFRVNSSLIVYLIVNALLIPSCPVGFESVLLFIFKLLGRDIFCPRIAARASRTQRNLNKVILFNAIHSGRGLYQLQGIPAY